jgi:hypothetical protein
VHTARGRPDDNCYGLEVGSHRFRAAGGNALGQCANSITVSRGYELQQYEACSICREICLGVHISADEVVGFGLTFSFPVILTRSWTRLRPIFDSSESGLTNAIFIRLLPGRARAGGRGSAPVERVDNGGCWAPFWARFFGTETAQEIFRIAFKTFQTIVKAVGPEKYLGKHPMHTSITKIIDNGAMGFVARTRKQFHDLIPSGVQWRAMVRDDGGKVGIRGNEMAPCLKTEERLFRSGSLAGIGVAGIC